MGYNVFADMGLPNPEIELLKSQIIISLQEMMTEKEVTADRAAYLWGVSAREVPSLLEGGWDDYSVEDLMRFADALNRNVRIIVNSRDVAPNEEARTLVLTA